MDLCISARDSELCERRSVNIKLLHKNEEVHVVGAVNLNPEMSFRITDQNRFPLKQVAEGDRSRIRSNNIANTRLFDWSICTKGACFGVKVELC